jgi:glycosyltransferase involved in cell wall biosynthesis
LLGERHDVPALAQALDLHVLPSLTEGFPNVVAETMLSSTPNVATDVGDAGLIVGDTGWIVAPGEPGQLAEAIARAHRDWSGSSANWCERGLAARQRVVDNFSLGRMVGRYERVWERAAAQLSPRRPPPDFDDAKTPGAPLRILHVINSLTLGGAEALLYRIVSRDTTNEHIVISLAGPAWYSARLEDKKIQVHHLGIDTVGDSPQGFLRLAKLVRESGADVVQCWLYRSNLLGGLAAKRAGTPVVWGIHCSSLDPLRPISRAVARLGGVVARWVPDFVINCSTRSAEIHRHLGYSAAEGAVVHNGYDSSIWFPDEPTRRKARDALGVDPDDFVIGSIARWDPQKDIPNLLAALRLVRERSIPFRCLLIGAGLGPDNAAAMELIDQTGCRDIIVPLGPRSDVQDLARALDLHVLASCGAEAFPNVVAESMLSGTPNVVTDVGDAAYMVGESGWVAPPRDPERLADAIAEAFHEWKDAPARWSQRRQDARERIAGNFSFESMVEAYRTVWRNVAAGAAGHSALNPTAVQ